MSILCHRPPRQICWIGYHVSWWLVAHYWRNPSLMKIWSLELSEVENGWIDEKFCQQVDESLLLNLKYSCSVFIGSVEVWRWGNFMVQPNTTIAAHWILTCSRYLTLLLVRRLKLSMISSITSSWLIVISVRCSNAVRHISLVLFGENIIPVDDNNCLILSEVWLQPIAKSLQFLVPIQFQCNFYTLSHRVLRPQSSAT